MKRIAIGMALCGLMHAAVVGPRFHQMATFGGLADGERPVANLIRDAAGNLYGTAGKGGSNGFGVVFKIDTNGQYTVVHNFVGLDGAFPYSGVIQDTAGNLYGTTFGGGVFNHGVVFRIDPQGVERVLYSFTGGADGANPAGGVIQDSTGNLYGTTEYGGISAWCFRTVAHGCGVVFKIDASGHETVLHTFAAQNVDGVYPVSGLVRDAAGNLYGTTWAGFTGTCGDGCGTVYKIDAKGTYTTMQTFNGTTQGGEPLATLALDAAGNLYGTGSWGGHAGLGVIFKLDTAGQLMILHSFNGVDAVPPYSGLTIDAAGNLYGTAYDGLVYKLDKEGHETVIYRFRKPEDGEHPEASLVRDEAGNLYGTTAAGGTKGKGVVFRIDPSGKGKVLHSFRGMNNGRFPAGGLAAVAGGGLVGATQAGGAADKGVVFCQDAAGNQTILHSFRGGDDGANPQAGVIPDAAGNLYGTTANGGASNAGVVFKLDTAGNEAVLYTFTGGGDGSSPRAPLILDSSGSLYGTTHQGGASNAGVIFKLDPSGHQTVLYSFTGGLDGANPQTGLVLDAAGNLYGTAEGGGAGPGGYLGGVVFRLDPAGHETVLYNFNGQGDGAHPNGLIRDAAGNLYGTTRTGGINGSCFGFGCGVIFQLDPVGKETVLYSFVGLQHGGSPAGTLVMDAAGNLYGGTSSPTFSDAQPVVFKLDATGQYSVLHLFRGHLDGYNPTGSLARKRDGYLYGLAATDGAGHGGVAFRIRP